MAGSSTKAGALSAPAKSVNGGFESQDVVHPEHKPRLLLMGLKRYAEIFFAA